MTVTFILQCYSYLWSDWYYKYTVVDDSVNMMPVHQPLSREKGAFCSVNLCKEPEVSMFLMTYCRIHSSAPRCLWFISLVCCNPM